MSTVAGYLEEKFPVFDAELRHYLAEHASLKTIKAGERLIRTGQYFQTTLLVAEGKIKIYREGDDGNEFFMYFLEPGNACALSMICAAKNEASQIMAEAMEDSVVIAFPVGMMDGLMREYRSWYYFVLENYRTRFEELITVVDSIAFKSLDERLEFYLASQAKALNTQNLSLTHQQIANDLNSSREVISRLLKKMEKDKRVNLHRNSIELISVL